MMISLATDYDSYGGKMVRINDEFELTQQEFEFALREFYNKKMNPNKEENLDPYRFNNLDLIEKETNNYITKLTLKDDSIVALLKKGITDILTEQLRDNPAGVESVYFNEPYVIVIFDDGEKIISKVSEEDIYDPKIGLAMAITIKIFGTRSEFHKFTKKHLEKDNRRKELKREKEGTKEFRKEFLY
jgi:hypothetical protein